MLSFIEWLKVEKRMKKKKGKGDEQRSNQTYGEGGNLNQQREVAGGNPQVAQQTVHVFAVPELQGRDCGRDDLRPVKQSSSRLESLSLTFNLPA